MRYLHNNRGRGKSFAQLAKYLFISPAVEKIAAQFDPNTSMSSKKYSNLPNVQHTHGETTTKTKRILSSIVIFHSAR